MADPPLPTVPNQLAQVAFAGQSLGEVLRQLAAIAAAGIDGCDSAGLSIAGQGPEKGMASSDSVAATLDSAQYDMGGGPCLLCQETGRSQGLDAAEEDPRWRGLAEVARGSGILSCLGVPLVVEGEVLGALNLYSRTRQAFGPALQEEAAAMAGAVSLVVSNAQRHDAAIQEVTRLRALMRGPAEIVALATGILMARHGRTAESALAHMADDARRQGRTVEDTARLVVSSIR